MDKKELEKALEKIEEFGYEVVKHAEDSYDFLRGDTRLSIHKWDLVKTFRQDVDLTAYEVHFKGCRAPGHTGHGNSFCVNFKEGMLLILGYMLLEASL